MTTVGTSSYPTYFNLVQEGESGAQTWRVFFTKDNHKISPWHDIPLVANASKQTYNMVVEIPRGTNAKLEISTGEDHNPIKQDIKNNKLRFVADVNGFKGYFANYGAFPQTWEDPSYVHPDTGAKGDRDPLDVVEIGEHIGKTGELKEVKILGVLAMIDEGETDWKVITVDVHDPLADKLNDVKDVEALKPGLLKSIHDWFRDYKIPDGKPPNVFAFDGQTRDREFALHIIKENHEFWAKKFSPVKH